jgi:hypothetical protein
MTTHTPAQARSIWKDTQAIAPAVKARTLRPAHSEPPKPAAKTQAEKEADRWVAEMMFDHYNG